MAKLKALGHKHGLTEYYMQTTHLPRGGIVRIHTDEFGILSTRYERTN